MNDKRNWKLTSRNVNGKKNWRITMNKYNSDETVDYDFEITFQEFVDSLPAPESYPQIKYKETQWNDE